MKKVLLLWYFEEDNFGDILLYRTTRNFLAEHNIITISYEVGQPCMDIFHEANKTDFLLFAGGGIIERGVPNVIRHFQEDYYLLQVPYGVIGLGVADWDYSKYKEEIGFWIDHSEFFFVRDDYSENRLFELVGKNKATCSTDCVFHNRDLLKYGNRIGFDVGINLRDLPFKERTGDIDDAVIRKIYEECNVSCIIPDASEEQLEKLVGVDNSDLLIKYRLMDRGEKVEAIINEIRGCQFLIAMRFHVILVSAVLGVLPIPIIYHEKVRSLVHSLGLDDLSVEINEFAKIPDKLILAKNNREAYLEKINEKVNHHREIADSMYSDIAHYFF